MTTILIIIAATGLGAAIGVWTRRLLAPLKYRLEAEYELAEPGSRLWLIVVSGLALGSVTASLAYTDNWPLALTILPLTVAAPALAAIDLDVMRLPNIILGPVALLTLAGLAIAAASRGDWSTPLRATAGALLAGGTLWLLNLITRGGVGFGDVKLAALVGLATGAVAMSAAWWAILVASASAFVSVAVARRSGPIPYGPWLLLGGWVAILGQLWP